MENPDNKKDLDQMPDVDENGEPVYKIDNSNEEADHNDDVVPLLVQDSPENPQDNEQDIKDAGSQE